MPGGTADSIFLSLVCVCVCVCARTCVSDCMNMQFNIEL
jgi:hypothetical protein